MGCNCGGGSAKTPGVKYEVRLSNGETHTADTKQEARIMIAAYKKGGTYRAVPAK